MMRIKKKHTSKIILTFVFVLTFSSLFLVQYSYTQKYPGGADSIPRWVGTQAWLREGISPYSKIVSERSQILISGRFSKGNEDRQLFVYPFYIVLFYFPVIWLPFNIARAIWMILIELSVIGILISSINLYSWSPPMWLIGLFIGLSLLMYNSIRTIILWQLAGTVAFLIILSIWALKEEKDILAGIALGFATIKPQMIFLILPFLIIWALFRKRWNFIITLGITLITLLVFSFVFEPNWISEMLTQILEYPSYTVTPSILIIFTSLFQPSIGMLLNYVIIIIASIWLLLNWKIVFFENKNFDYVVALTLIITNVIVTRTATTNYLMMLPVFCYIFSIAEKKYANSSYIPVFILYLLFTISTWVIFALSMKNGFETWPSYFPIPFFLIGGLIWVRFNNDRDLSLSGL